MAAAAIASLFMNLILTAGIYSLVGFEVTPSTVIGFLTILGFALYDVVVVFDKVQENTRGITANNAAVRVFRARKALLGRVEKTCGHCAQGGGCGDDCTCAHHAV